MSQLTLFVASAADLINKGANAACDNGKNCGSANLTTIFSNITNTLIFLVGAISVIFIILGGLRYVTSNGDSKQTTQAKDTILYAVIGVAVSLIAFAIVKFVSTSFAK